MWAFLADPKVLTVVLASFGGAVGWLWGKVSAIHRKHRQCEIALAKAEERERTRDNRIEALEDTCARLTRLIKKETKLG